jgi:hypothetical protein
MHSEECDQYAMNGQRPWLRGDKRDEAPERVAGGRSGRNRRWGWRNAGRIPTAYSPHACKPTCLHAHMPTCPHAHGRTNPGIGRIHVLVRPWISQGRERSGRALNWGGRGRAGRSATEGRGFLNEAEPDASSRLGFGFGFGLVQEGGGDADEGEVVQ